MSSTASLCSGFPPLLAGFSLLSHDLPILFMEKLVSDMIGTVVCKTNVSYNYFIE